MGRDIETTEFTRDDRLQFREKVKANLAALRTLVDSGSFETGRRTCGVEMEVYITDADGVAGAVERAAPRAHGVRRLPDRAGDSSRSSST